MIGRIVGFINRYGRTPTGFTSVVTTAHTVADMEKALAFYYGPLHMTLFLESVLQGEVTNRALSLPADAKTRSVIVQGDHEYGKIALASAMNYQIPTIATDAVPPNIGYLAQSFRKLPRQGHRLILDSRGNCGLGKNISGGTRTRPVCVPGGPQPGERGAAGVVSGQLVAPVRVSRAVL